MLSDIDSLRFVNGLQKFDCSLKVFISRMQILYTFSLTLITLIYFSIYVYLLPLFKILNLIVLVTINSPIITGHCLTTPVLLKMSIKMITYSFTTLQS